MTAIKIARAAAWLLLLAAVFLTLAPRPFRPYTGVERHLEHFLAFGALGLLFAIGYPNHRRLLALIGVAAALVLETLQLWSPGRHANVSDFAVNAMGLCIGVAIVYAIDRMWRASRRPPEARPVSESADLVAAAARPVHPPTTRR